MPNEIELYDQRQYRLMLKKIEYYKLGKVILNYMLSDVGALIGNLNLKDHIWIKKITNLTANIDYCNLNWQDKSFSEESRLDDKKELDKYIEDLIILIESKIDKNLTDEDVEYKY